MVRFAHTAVKTVASHVAKFGFHQPRTGGLILVCEFHGALQEAVYDPRRMAEGKAIPGAFLRLPASHLDDVDMSAPDNAGRTKHILSIPTAM